NLPRRPPPGLGRPAPEPRVAAQGGLLRPGGRRPRALAPDAPAPGHRAPVRLRPGADQRRLHPALSPPVLRWRPLRPPRLAPPRARGRARAGGCRQRDLTHLVALSSLFYSTTSCAGEARLRGGPDFSRGRRPRSLKSYAPTEVGATAPPSRPSTPSPGP